MSQANRTTANLVNFKSTARTPVTLALSVDQMETLRELCTLAAYHPDGFTYTKAMEATCRAIADRSGPSAIAACLARADIRERAYICR